jgi:GTP-binding protein
MRFIDEAIIEISGGHGGPGSISFRREAHEPMGGPDGGDGGAGGDVIFEACEQLATLQDFRYKRSYSAQNGLHGSGTNKAGKDGKNVELKVPVGTVIRDFESGEILVDFTHPGQVWTACTGGRGGKGNAHFVTSRFQAPKFAQPGEPGTSLKIKLELKLIADMAIIGYPNAGKSTFISRISAARPKIADYAFTTLTPNLGVVSLPDYRTFVIADIPGLIDGAHRGLGLGHKFLKHIERTRFFIHLLDGAQFLEEATLPHMEDSFNYAIDNLVKRYTAIRNELGLFNEALLHKPEIVVFNKLDTLQGDLELLQKARQALRERIASIRGSHPEPGEPYTVSAVTGSNIPELLNTLWDKLTELKSSTPSRVTLPDDVSIRRD